MDVPEPAYRCPNCGDYATCWEGKCHRRGDVFVWYTREDGRPPGLPTTLWDHYQAGGYKRPLFSLPESALKRWHF